MNSTSNTTSPLEALYFESRAQLANFGQYNWIALTGGSIGLASTIFTIFIILRTQELRKSTHHLNVVHLSFAAGLNCLAAIFVAARRSTLLLSGSDDVIQPWPCVFILWTAFFGIVAQFMQHCALSLSRCIALIWPIRFHNADINQLQLLNGFFWLLAVALSFVKAFRGVVGDRFIPVCMDAKLYELWVQPFHRQLIDGIRYFSIGCTALFVLVLFWRRKWMASVNEANARMATIASRNSLIILVIYVVAIGIPMFLVPAIQRANAAVGTAILPYGLVPSMIDPFVGLLFFLCFDSFFRDAVIAATNKAFKMESMNKVGHKPSSGL